MIILSTHIIAVVKKVLDEAAPSKEAHDQDSEMCDAVKAKLAYALIQMEEANDIKDRLEAKRSANCEKLMCRISELERVEADLTLLLRAEA